MSVRQDKLKAKVFVRYENHFDLVWRRCWKKNYRHLGLLYRSYADVEEALISRCLELADKQGAAFQLEQALSLREYLARHPDKLPLFKKLHKEKRFALLGAGEAIIDTNMCSGETMARNYVSGTRYAIKLFGEAAKFANHSDGFGSSAQFPQIVRGCGMTGIDRLSYSRPDAPYWRGLDGSTVFTGFVKPGKIFLSDHCYYEPCLPCRGVGSIKKTKCADCEGTGLRISQGVYPKRDWIEELEQPFGQYVIRSEEMLPDEKLVELVKKKNRDGKIQYMWGTAENMFPLWEESLAKADDPSVEISSRVENNPIQTGTLVSRIRIKQAARRAEAAFFAAEKISAIANFAKGGSSYAETDKTWLNLPILFFHDAITGTHNDPASEELLEIAEKTVSESGKISLKAARKLIPGASDIDDEFSGGTIAVFNPLGFEADIPVEMQTDDTSFEVSDKAGRRMPVFRQPSEREPMAREFSPVGAGYYVKRNEKEPSVLGFVAGSVPALSFKTFNVRKTKGRSSGREIKEDNGSFEIGDYRIKWDTHGVTSVYSSRKKAELLELKKGRAGYLMLEDDVGDPWGTRDFGRKRTDCQKMQTFHSAKETDDKFEIVFSGNFENSTFGREIDPSVFGLEWIQKVIVTRNLPWVEFRYDLFWQAVNRRIRIVFPSKSKEDRGLYSIPYGVLWRDRYEMAENALWSPNGDWPSLFYTASSPAGKNPGMAVINTGTPSARIEDGAIMYSVLRSPGFGHCLLRYAQDYPMPTSEIRDGGHHLFRFGLMPFDGDIPEIQKAGEILNSGAPVFGCPGKTKDEPSPFSVSEPGVFVESVKTAYQGGIALRVVEMEGRGRTLEIAVPERTKKVLLTNMLEEPLREVLLTGSKIKLEIKPFQIVTLVLQSNKGNL
ncbi:MAG: glycosyl hydrolase-related protein [Victivallales bacterium]